MSAATSAAVGLPRSGAIRRAVLCTINADSPCRCDPMVLVVREVRCAEGFAGWAALSLRHPTASGAPRVKAKLVATHSVNHPDRREPDKGRPSTIDTYW